MGRGAKEWVRRNPLKAFFLLATAICFGSLFPAIYLIPQEDTFGQILSFYLARLGVYSPVLAGMTVVRLLDPVRDKVSSGRRLLLFLPVWLIAIIIHSLSLKYVSGSDAPLIVLIVLSLPVALLPALVISSVFSGTVGIQRMVATLVKPRGRPVYYLVALLTFPAIHFLGVVITNLLSGNRSLPEVSLEADVAFTLPLTFLSVLLFSGGINEESGWRGFGQRKLQARYSPLVANLILCFLMVVWHIPNDLLQYREGGYLLVRIGLYPFITLLFGWIYNRTQGSILAPVIFHASMNSLNPVMEIFPITTAGNILLVGFALAVVISDRMWRRLPQDHPAVCPGNQPGHHL